MYLGRQRSAPFVKNPLDGTDFVWVKVERDCGAGFDACDASMIFGDIGVAYTRVSEELRQILNHHNGNIEQRLTVDNAVNTCPDRVWLTRPVSTAPRPAISVP
jgi:hypothetical protein